MAALLAEHDLVAAILDVPLSGPCLSTLHRRASRAGRCGGPQVRLPKRPCLKPTFCGYWAVVVERVSSSFVPDAAQVAVARKFVVDKAAAWGLDTDDVALVVSELAANAVQHAGSPFTVSLCCDAGRLLVEVADSSSQLPGVVARCDEQLTHGRGLLIVDALPVRGVFSLTPAGRRFGLNSAANDQTLGGHGTWGAVSLLSALQSRRRRPAPVSRGPGKPADSVLEA